MDDTYYRDPMELFDLKENKDLYIQSHNKHSKSYVFKFNNNYGAHIICEPLSTFSINPLVFKSEYLFDTAILDEGKIHAKSGLGFNRIVDILQQIKNLPDYVEPEYVPHKTTKRPSHSNKLLNDIYSDLAKRRNKEAISKCQNK